MDPSGSSTRVKILEASLDLFAQKGFEAVSVQDIAAAVGIQKSSLYNHFQSKREIFNTLVDLCWRKAQDYFSSQGLPFSMEDDLSPFLVHDLAQLEENVLSVFRYFFEDPWNTRFRQLLMLSQYTDPAAAELYRQLFFDYPMKFQSRLFAHLMEQGQLRQGDPESLALEFYGAVFLLLHRCQNWNEAQPRLTAFFRQFQNDHKGD